MGLVRGGRLGHGLALAGVAALGGPGAAVVGLGVDYVYWWRGEQDARCCSRGEGDVDMGRRWRAWRRLGERERREQGPGGSWWRLGE